MDLILDPRSSLHAVPLLQFEIKAGSLSGYAQEGCESSDLLYGTLLKRERALQVDVCVE